MYARRENGTQVYPGPALPLLELVGRARVLKKQIKVTQSKKKSM